MGGRIMRDYNYIPFLKDGVVYFVNIRDAEVADIIQFACTESDIKAGPEYFYNQYKEKYA